MTSGEWTVLNRERGELIDASIAAGGLNKEQATRLAELNVIADLHIEEVAPLPTEALDRLQELINRARQHNLTDEEREQFRRSFAYGNCKLANDSITREDIDRAAEGLRSDDTD